MKATPGLHSAYYTTRFCHRCYRNSVDGMEWTLKKMGYPSRPHTHVQSQQ